MSKILTIAIILGLTGCGAVDLSKPIMLNTTPPEGPIAYQKGWRDGCESGIASTNTSFYMAIGTSKYILDEKLRYNHLYAKAWQYGYNHCGYSMKALAQYKF